MNIVEKLKQLTSNKHNKEVVKRSSSAIIIRLSGFFLAYLFTFLVARFYGAEANGLFSLSLTVLTLLVIIGRMGFDVAMVKGFSKNLSSNQEGVAKATYLKILSFVIPFSIALSAAFYFLTPYLAEYIFQKESLIPAFHIISFAVPGWTITVINASVFRGYRNTNAFVFYMNMGRFLLAVAFLLITIYLLTVAQPLMIPVIVYMLSCNILGAISIIQIVMKLRNVEAAKAQDHQFMALWQEAFPMFLSTAMVFLMGWLDTLVLGIYRSESDVGVYYVAVKLATVTSFVLTAVNSISAPKFAELYYGNSKEEFRNFVSNVTQFIFWGSLPILLILLLFPRLILSIFGEEFPTAWLALSILTVGQFVNAFSGSVGNILQMTGYQKVFRNILSIGLLINILLNFTLAPQFGKEGVAIASMVSLSFWNITSALFIKKRMKVSTFYNPLVLFQKTTN